MSFSLFKRAFGPKERVRKPTKGKRSIRSKQQLFEKLDSQRREKVKSSSFGVAYTISVGTGKERRLFCCHEEYLWKFPSFAEKMNRILRDNLGKLIEMPDEDPEVFACVLEYLYNRDYPPAVLLDRRRGISYLDKKTQGHSTHNEGDATVYHARHGYVILRDTAIYCSAERLGLTKLKELALQKQELRVGHDIALIIRSMRYAWANTEEHGNALQHCFLKWMMNHLRRCLRSGPMQMELENGGRIWSDLFSTMCGRIEELSTGEVLLGSPRTI